MGQREELAPCVQGEDRLGGSRWPPEPGAGWGTDVSLGGWEGPATIQAAFRQSLRGGRATGKDPLVPPWAALSDGALVPGHCHSRSLSPTPEARGPGTAFLLYSLTGEGTYQGHPGASAEAGRVSPCPARWPPRLALWSECGFPQESHKHLPLESHVTLAQPLTSQVWAASSRR